MRDHFYDRVLGCLTAASMGDAMGSATEQWATHEIVARYGAPIREFHVPPPDSWSAGNKAAELTDDASMMFALAEAIVGAGGTLTTEQWVQALLHWADTSPMARMMGPSTSAVVQALREGRDPANVGTVYNTRRQVTRMGSTNGAAMRIAPAGLIHPGDVEGAVHEALVSCLPTHNTHIGISAAAAIAAGVAEAITPGAGVYSVARACVRGARLGEELGIRQARWIAGPSVPRRIELAISLAARAQSFMGALELLRDYLGCSVAAAESVPVAIGLFVYAGGDPLESVAGGANIGDDTDTIACMAGALAGALSGFRAIPPDLYRTLRAANDVDIEQIASGLAEVAAMRWSGGVAARAVSTGEVEAPASGEAV
jgi:ADP-ribosylglycohydrolase